MKSLLLTLASALTVCAAAQSAPLRSFHPGEIWPDDNGLHINAHGGGILFHEGVYYWFGQHMIAGDGNSHDHADWCDARILAETTR